VRIHAQFSLTSAHSSCGPCDRASTVQHVAEYAGDSVPATPGNSRCPLAVAPESSAASSLSGASQLVSLEGTLSTPTAANLECIPSLTHSTPGSWNSAEGHPTPLTLLSPALPSTMSCTCNPTAQAESLAGPSEGLARPATTRLAEAVVTEGQQCITMHRSFTASSEILPKTPKSAPEGKYSLAPAQTPPFQSVHHVHGVIHKISQSCVTPSPALAQQVFSATPHDRSTPSPNIVHDKLTETPQSCITWKPVLQQGGCFARCSLVPMAPAPTPYTISSPACIICKTSLSSCPSGLATATPSNTRTTSLFPTLSEKTPVQTSLSTPPTPTLPVPLSAPSTPQESPPSDACMPFPRLVEASYAEHSAQHATSWPTAETALQNPLSATPPYLPFLQPSHASLVLSQQSGSTPTLQQGGSSLATGTSVDGTPDSMRTQRSVAIHQAALCGKPRGPQGDSFDPMRASCLAEGLATHASVELACTKPATQAAAATTLQVWAKPHTCPSMAAEIETFPAPSAQDHVSATVGKYPGWQRPLLAPRCGITADLLSGADDARADLGIANEETLPGLDKEDWLPSSPHLTPWQQEPLAQLSAASSATNPTGPSLLGGTTASFASESDNLPSDPFLASDPFGAASDGGLFSDASSLTSAASVPQQCSARLRGGSAVLDLPPWAMSSLGSSPRQHLLRLRDVSAAIGELQGTLSPCRSVPAQSSGQEDDSCSVSSNQECIGAMSIAWEQSTCREPQTEKSWGGDSISLWTPDMDNIVTHFRAFGNPLSWQWGALQGAHPEALRGASVCVLPEQFTVMSAHLNMSQSLQWSADGLEVYSRGCASENFWLKQRKLSRDLLLTLSTLFPIRTK
jgi:hypothetical protein